MALVRAEGEKEEKTKKKWRNKKGRKKEKSYAGSLMPRFVSWADADATPESMA